MSADDSGRLRSVLIRFHERLVSDASAERRPSLMEYLELFPGYEVEIAEEYLRLRADEHPSVSHRPSRSSDDPTRFGAYRLMDMLGRGGQGVVYKAEDTRLGRLVALKMLAPGFDSEAGDLLRRFRREAEAAGRLDHPGICAVYETGSQDGVPFIAMRFVEGETLAAKISAGRKRVEAGEPLLLDLGTEALVPDDGLPTLLLDDGQPEQPGKTPVDDFHTSMDGPTVGEDGESAPDPPATPAPGPSPDLTQRRGGSRTDVLAVVALIEKVARALHVAHQAGVVHRDIKPANIMIQQGARPVILDFGLARGESAELTLTRTGELFGTLPYMAPEQLREHSTGMDQRTDVYALGVTAYECLALGRPFEAPTQEALFNAILERDPPGLRGRNPAVSRDLEVVIETALEKDTARRYRTALEFAEELRRVREREPIVARPAGPLLRVWRWAQRNPSLAASLVVILVLLSSWIIRLRGDVDRERRETARRLAEAERATRRFEEGRRLAGAFFEGVHDEVLDLPGSTRARQMMVTAALRYLDGLKEDAADIGALQVELLQGYKRVAQVQGDPGASHLGDFSGALASLGKARAVLAKIREREPAVAEHDLTDIDLALREVDVLRALGRVREATEHAAAAEERARRLHAANADSLHRDLLGAALVSHARALLDLGSIRDARPLVEEARNLIGGEAPDHPVITLADEQTADIASRTGDSRGAAQIERRMLARARERLKADPQSVSLRREVAQRLLALASLEEEFEGMQRALDRTREAMAIIDSLVAADPHDLRARRELARGHIEQGRRLIVAGRTADGHKKLESAFELEAEIEAVDTRNLAFSVRFGAALSELGETLLWMGRTSAARDHMKRALDRLVDVVPEDGAAGWQPLHELSTAWRRMGQIHFQGGDMITARRHFEKGVGILRKIVREVLEDKVQSDLASAIDEVADTHVGGMADTALEGYLEAMAIRERLRAEDPKNLVYARNLGISHYNVGRTLGVLGRTGEALTHLRKSLGVDRILVAADPSNLELLANLAISEYKLGRMLTDEDREAEGRTLLQAAVDRLEGLFKNDPENKLCARDLVPCLQALGVVCARMEDWDATIEASERLLEILAILRQTDVTVKWYARERRVCLVRLLQVARATGSPEDQRRWRLALRRADADDSEAKVADLIAVALALVDARTPRSLRDPAAALAYARRATAAEAKNAFAFEALARALEATGAAGAAAAAMETAVSLLGAGDTRRGAWSERLARLKAAAR